MWTGTRLVSRFQRNAAVNNTGFYAGQGYLIRSPNPKGIFQSVIPARHIFGFMDDYSKVTYGMRDTLQLIRKDDNDALFRTHAAGAGKVVLSKLAWSVPIVQPNVVRNVICTRVLPRIVSFPYRFVYVNVNR